jgi:outer membrane protein TolC
VPLGNRSARNTFKSAKANQQRIALQLKQLQQQILIQIEDALSVAQTSFQRAKATKDARIYAEQALEAEQKKLESGKSTSFEVLRLQRDLTSARLNEIRSLADYNIALARIASAEGSTLDRRRVSITFD